MREILFRGKSTTNGKWLEGYYKKIVGVLKTSHFIIPERESASSFYSIFIDGETLSEYVNRKDRNGRRIFEGDIIRLLCPNDGDEEEQFTTEYFEIVFNEESAAFKMKSMDKGARLIELEVYSQKDLEEYNAEVIGNRWEGMK